MSKIRQSARGQNCTVRLPTICSHDAETTVYAHLSGVRFGHGVGRKVSDLHGAWCCSACHDALDGRTKTVFYKDDLKLAHLEAVIETQLKLLEMGLIKI